MLYVSHKRGVKAGGFNNGLVNFNITEVDIIPFDNEENDSFEVGVKWSNDQGNLRVNAAAFYYDYQDYQATTFSVENASLGVQVLNKDAEVAGAEIEVFANIADGLDMFLGFGYVETEVKDITKPTTSGIQTKDRELGQAPHFQSNGMVRYEADLFGIGVLTNQIIFSYIGDRYVDVLNDSATKLPSHINVNLNTTFEPIGSNWYISAQVKNLTNKTEQSQMFNFASLYQTGQINYNSPRFYKLEIGYRW